MKKFLALCLSSVLFIMIINVKMPTIVGILNVKMPKLVGILTFMSRINFVLSLVEHEKRIIITGPNHVFFLWFHL